MNRRWFGMLFALVYVLPYPGYMPGNRLYSVSRFVDRIKEPFYFGNISAYKYHLSLADKYLVEAKTLFEYKQYLLAVDALKRSDEHFSKAPGYLRRAGKEGKDVRAFTAQLNEAASVHKNILEMLRTSLPPAFTWEPEHALPTVLPLANMLEESMRIRETL